MKALNECVIFHIGNIANNAYNSAAYERKLGLNSYALSPDYLHVMGFPFWETEELLIPAGETFLPEKFVNNLNTPDWFLAGNWVEIGSELAKIFLKGSEKQNQILTHSYRVLFRKQLLRVASNILKKFRPILGRTLPGYVRHHLANTFLVQLRQEPADSYLEVFKYADIIVFYGPYNAYAVISKWEGKYISLEHGTLRDYIFSDTYFANQSKIGYQKSFRVLITNQDCLESANECGITPDKIVKAPHPTSDFDFQELRKQRLVICKTPRNEILWPTRHSYGSIVDRGKGNKEGIDAIFLILQNYPKLRVIFVEWGDDVHLSKKLIRSLGLENQVEWIGVLSRKALKLRMIRSLVVLDQFTIPAYGGITADALGLGVPVITRMDNLIDMAYFGSVAPVLPAATGKEISDQVTSLLVDKNLDKNIFDLSTAWYDKHLSSELSFSRRNVAYIDLLAEKSQVGGDL